MKISKERAHQMAVKIADRLCKEELVTFVGTKEPLVLALTKVVIDELSVEDQLNQEVRTLLKQYESEFEKGRADYQKMFALVKNKLIRERNLVL